MEYANLGKIVFNLRKSHTISQQTLADSVGISRATINALEKNRSGDIGIKKVMKILAYFDMELSIKLSSPLPTFEELRGE